MSEPEAAAPTPPAPPSFPRALWGFVRRVLGDFRRNQGFLLASAVAYNALLSIVPLFAILLVALSHVLAQRRLVDAVQENLTLLLPPSSARALTEQVVAFIEHRDVIGGVGGLVLLFFSSIAFSVLESAMSVIFHHRVVIRRRHFLVSAILPYAFIFALGIGLLLITLISGALDVVGRDTVRVLGHTFALAGPSRFALWLLGMAGFALMLTALYMVMPVGRIAFRRALVGGVTATVLWEIIRRILVWYFATLSMVNVIYGSLAVAVMLLLSLEAAAIVVLLGAQVIADIDRSLKLQPGRRIGLRT